MFHHSIYIAEDTLLLSSAHTGTTYVPSKHKTGNLKLQGTVGETVILKKIKPNLLLDINEMEKAKVIVTVSDTDKIVIGNITQVFDALNKQIEIAVTSAMQLLKRNQIKTRLARLREKHLLITKARTYKWKKQMKQTKTLLYWERRGLQLQLQKFLPLSKGNFSNIRWKSNCFRTIGKEYLLINNESRRA